MASPTGRYPSPPERQDFPSGYLSCCGRSKARGHAEECSRHPKNVVQLEDIDFGKIEERILTFYLGKE